MLTVLSKSLEYVSNEIKIKMRNSLNLKWVQIVFRVSRKNLTVRERLKGPVYQGQADSIVDVTQRMLHSKILSDMVKQNVQKVERKVVKNRSGH